MVIQRYEDEMERKVRNNTTQYICTYMNHLKKSQYRPGVNHHQLCCVFVHTNVIYTPAGLINTVC